MIKKNTNKKKTITTTTTTTTTTERLKTIQEKKEKLQLPKNLTSRKNKLNSVKKQTSHMIVFHSSVHSYQQTTKEHKLKEETERREFV